MTVSSMTIPRPVQLVIDDVGWREGWDLSARGGPYRSGVSRLLGPADYHAVADVGRELAIRPQCAMVLCEWDRENVCAQYPTTTQQGAAWDNASRSGPWADEAAAVFVERAGHIEFAMHGVGHEHWENGERTRAEWFGRDPSEIWDSGVLRGHLACFRRILEQVGLDADSGMAFPPSFVPCGFRYYWDNDSPDSTGALMRSAGVRFCSTPYSACCFASGPPEKPDGGFDHRLIVLDRGHSGVPWNTYAAVPQELPTTSICGVHWPNLLMEVPEANTEAVAAWVAYLRQIEALDGWMLAKNMGETCSQWLHHSYATLRVRGGSAELDTAAIPSEAKLSKLVGNPIVKVPLGEGEHVAAVRSADCRAVACWESAGWALIVLRLDRPPRASFEVELGPEPMALAVRRQSTYDVLDLEEQDGAVRLAVRAYGRQTVHLRLPFRPGSVEAVKGRLVVRGVDYNPQLCVAAVVIEGRDIHGEDGEVVLKP